MMKTHHYKSLYGALIVSAYCEIQIRAYCKENGLTVKDDRPFHCTFCYSDRPVMWSYGMEYIDEYNQPHAKFISHEEFSSRRVMMLECAGAAILHQALMISGATSRYNDYIPMLTLCDIDSDSSLDVVLPPYPHIITFDKIVYKPLIENENPISI